MIEIAGVLMFAALLIATRFRAEVVFRSKNRWIGRAGLRIEGLFTVMVWAYRPGRIYIAIEYGSRAKVPALVGV